MDTTRTPADAVRGLWRTLSARDWDGIADWVTDDCIYVDMPVGPAFAARGPVDIVKRLHLGLRDLAAYENHEGRLVAEGDLVMYEHSETWTFATGEVIELPFVTVHQVRDGRVSLWKDYWDFGGVANSAPPGCWTACRPGTCPGSSMPRVWSECWTAGAGIPG